MLIRTSYLAQLLHLHRAHAYYLIATHASGCDPLASSETRGIFPIQDLDQMEDPRPPASFTLPIGSF